MPNNFVSYSNAISLMTGVNNKKVGKSDLTDIFATGTTNDTGSEISSGTYFYLNDVLVKAIDDIAVGDTFTEDTNYEVVNGVLNEETSTGGGHTIQDASGNKLPQESDLQFAGYLKTTDDSSGKKTVVSDAPTEITYDDYMALTPAQKQGTKWLITNAPDSTGSGHTIKDGDGTAMPTQPNLQFADANVSNDGTGDATVVRNFVDINWDDWQEVNDNDDTYYRVTDAPLVDGNVEIDLMTKLWENTDPTASFVAQDATLSSDDYDFLIINAYYATSILRIASTIIVRKGENGSLSVEYTSGGNNPGAVVIRRDVTYVNDKKLSISNGLMSVGATAESQNNTGCIPIVIYGIKQKVTIPLSAIISNVSTSASKCMLLDGETSVEDTLNYSTDEHVVGKWIDGTTDVYEKTVTYSSGLPNASRVQISLGISNLNEVVSCNIESYDSTQATTIEIPYYDGGNVISSLIRNSLSEIWITTSSGAFTGFTRTRITIRYTKTS